MSIRELTIPGCLVYEPKIHKDDRGRFFEWFQDSTFSQISGDNFNLAQANCSISKKGVLRGIHFTSRDPGQSKLVTVFAGKVFDVMVDLRKSSPTFGKWESIILDSSEPKTIYIPWGVGHGFLALEEDTVFSYLCDERYNPSNEFDLNALDEEIGIEWPSGISFLRSAKDKNAPNLKSILKVLPK
jgi:dTDP-4-dehydrorhamnose 3,5-epimerase